MASDDFTGANGTDLETHDSAWDHETTNHFEIQGNAARPQNLFVSSWVHHSSTEDTCQIKIPNVASSGKSDRVYVMVRSDINRGDATNYGYNIYFSDDGTNLASVRLRIGDTYMTGNFSLSQTYALADTNVVKIVASGTTTVNIKVYINDTEEFDYDDTAGTFTSGHPGFGCTAQNGVAADQTFDDWTDGVSAGSIIPQFAHHYRANSR